MKGKEIEGKVVGSDERVRQYPCSLRCSAGRSDGRVSCIHIYIHLYRYGLTERNKWRQMQSWHDGFDYLFLF